MERIHKLLLQAIDGESGAEVQYKVNAETALKEGYRGVASLFSALSRAEGIHIANHKRALEKNGYSAALPRFDKTPQTQATQANLEAAIKAEREEFQHMYPSFRKQIKKLYGSSFAAKIALLSMKWATESEENHHDLLRFALDKVSSGKDVIDGEFYLCSVCGNIHHSDQPPSELCEVCGHDISFYSLIRVE